VSVDLEWLRLAPHPHAATAGAAVCDDRGRGGVAPCDVPLRDATLHAQPRAEVSRFTVLAVSSPVRARLAELVARFDLPREAADRYAVLLDLVAAEPASITSVRDPLEGVDVHIADSLVALELDVVRSARRIADLGSGAGFPGLALAVALPDARIALLESVTRKCGFLERAARALELDNATVVPGRAESWRDGLEAHDLVTARALAPLGVVLEYAAPLLANGGTLVAWKGRLEDAEARNAAAAATMLGMTTPQAHPVEPFTGAEARALYLSSKVRPTPPGFPRREGIARKRPLRAST
jgi:16S rRNA (guanine527-N7)-methyltransferase